MDKTQTKRKISRPRDTTERMNPETERPAKRPKLDADSENGKNRIPDDVLFKIFRLLSIHDRMRLTSVSKRLRQLVYLDTKRTVWNNTLSLTLQGLKNERITTINGLSFKKGTRTKALRVLVDNCAPFKRVEISVFLNSIDDIPWMSSFVRRVQEAQQSAGQAAPELSFRGFFRYAPVVFEKLVDGTQTKIDIELRSQKRHPTPTDWNNLKNVWSKISSCNGLTEFHFSTRGEARLYHTEEVVAALSEKQFLKKLSFKLADFESGRPVIDLAQVANSCPSLVALHGEERRRELTITNFSQVLFCLLDEAMTDRLQEFTFDGPPRSCLELQRGCLATECPNLRRLAINFENAQPVIEAYLTQYQLEDKVLTMDVTYSGCDCDLKKHRVALFGSLESLCDGLVMAPGGRFAFVKGSALVACKFLEEQ